MSTISDQQQYSWFTRPQPQYFYTASTGTANTYPLPAAPSQTGTVMQQPSFSVTTDTSGNWQTIPFSFQTGTATSTASVTIPNWELLGQTAGQTVTGFVDNLQQPAEQLQYFFNENPQWRTWFTEETPEQQAQKAKALEKSRELAKEWLSEKEFKALEEQGEIEIESTQKDILYVVKKDPYRRVAKRVVKRLKGVLATAISKVDIEEFCIHPLDPTLPLYDAVLSKVLLIKGDEKLFEESANKTVLPVPIAR